MFDNNQANMTDNICMYLFTTALIWVSNVWAQLVKHYTL